VRPAVENPACWACLAILALLVYLESQFVVASSVSFPEGQGGDVFWGARGDRRLAIDRIFTRAGPTEQCLMHELCFYGFNFSSWKLCLPNDLKEQGED
jgi:hypothetical protein